MTSVLTEPRPARPAPRRRLPAPPPRRPRPLGARLWRGPERDPAWARPTLYAILLLAAALYTWHLSANGLGNTYYAAAVKSGTESWKAFFFGAIDPGAFITVDKPPMALWIMGLSARVFGVSSWSLLLPEALAGVASVAVLWHLVKDWAGATAAALAATAFAITPVAVAMFRISDPDALLTLLLLLGVWGVWAAIRHNRALPLVLAGTVFGAAFLTKMLEAVVIVPALALAYVVCSRAPWRRTLTRLAAAGAAFLVSAGWWVAIVELWPASSRPYIGGSTNNSILDLIFGYNGLARVAGNGGPGGANFGGPPGWLRLFNTELGGQISWLLPLAGAGLVGGLWLAGRARRTNPYRAGFLVWGGYAVLMATVFSLAKGIFHPYYTVALAPAVAALVGAGIVALWHLGRRSAAHAWLLPAVIALTGWWSFELLGRTPSFAPGLRVLVLVAPVGAAVALGLARVVRRDRALALAAVAVGVVAVLAGPAAYAVATVTRASNGIGPAGGPAAAATATGFGAGPGPGGAAPGDGGLRAGGPPAGGGGPGGGNVDQAAIRYLEAHQGSAKYLVATFGSQSSAPIIISTGKAVVTIGGFNGGDPYPSLAAFEALVASGQVHYALVSGGGTGGGPGGGGPGGAGRGTTSAIASWVESHGTAVTVNGSTTTLYRVG